MVTRVPLRRDVLGEWLTPPPPPRTRRRALAAACVVSAAPVTAGVQYAIVASSSSCGLGNCYMEALGTVGDPYPAGAGLFSTNAGATWAPFSVFGSTDFPFQTYVLQAPTSKQQCKKGGWSTF